MPRLLISLAHKTVCVDLQRLGALVRWRQVWKVCGAFSVSSCFKHLPPALRVFDFPRQIHHFSSASHKHRLLQNDPPRLSLRQWFSSEPDMAEQRFIVEYAKRGTAGCKKCKDKIAKGIVRIGKVVPNPFSESAGEMKEWYHVKCIFEKLERARATTKKIEDITELEGWEELQDEDKELINKHVSGTTDTHSKWLFFTIQKPCFLVMFST